MNPYIFRFKSISVSWFIVLTLISIFLGLITVKTLKDKVNLSKSKLEDIYFILIFTGFIGARLSYVLLNFEAYNQNLSDIFKLTHFNLNLAGGVFFALAGLFIISKMQKISLYSLLEIYIIPFYLSMSIGVWSMFFNGMIVGREYEGFLSLKYLGKQRHMVVMYLSIMFILGIILQLTVLKKIKIKYKTPLLLLLILVCYYFIKIFFT